MTLKRSNRPMRPTTSQWRSKLRNQWGHQRTIGRIGGNWILRLSTAKTISIIRLNLIDLSLPLNTSPAILSLKEIAHTSKSTTRNLLKSKWECHNNLTKQKIYLFRASQLTTESISLIKSNQSALKPLICQGTEEKILASKEILTTSRYFLYNSGL